MIGCTCDPDKEWCQICEGMTDEAFAELLRRANNDDPNDWIPWREAIGKLGLEPENEEDAD